MTITQKLIKYYINFLETDFRKERWPKRKFKWKESFLNVWKRFPELAQLIFSELSKARTEEEEITLKIIKWKYFFKSDSSKTKDILESIKEFFDSNDNIIQWYLIKIELDKKKKLDTETINKISWFSHKSDFIDFFKNTEYIEVIQNIEGTHFADSWDILLWNISYYKLDEEWNKEYVDQNNESHPMANYLFQRLSDVITENDRQVLSSLSTYKEVEDFLSNIKDKDIFHILQDIDKDNKSNEKFDIFFNFLEIKISNTETKRIESFPLFFTQCELEYSNSHFIIKFNKTINFNRKLVRYLTQKIEWWIDRSLSPNEWILTQSDNFTSEINIKLSNLLNKIQVQQELKLEQLFKLKEIQAEKNIKIYQNLRQIAQKHIIGISNNCWFCVDEKEFVLIDPETLPEDDRIVINWFVDETINKILSWNPKNYNNDIQHEVDDMPIEDKLSYISPIPLNEQQIQILKALEKDWCNNIIVEWPPGTWKSHSIVAILQHCIKNNKKVLFVSDKKEALDVVEEKINNVFDNWNVRSPIIRIWWSSWENNFGKLLSPSYVTSLKNYIQNTKFLSEEHLHNHKIWINTRIQKEIDLVYNKIINNLGNIQYYLETEWKCEWFLKDFFVESDRNKENVVQLLEYVQILSNLNKDSFCDFNIFETDCTSVESERETIENLIGHIEHIEKKIEWSKVCLELVVNNFNKDSIFEEERKKYKKSFGVHLQTFIREYFDSEELDTFEQIKDFCEEIDFIRESLDKIHIKNIKNISLKDIKNKDTIEEISSLVKEYYKIYTEFLGITKIFKKQELETIAKSIKQICGNSSFDTLDFEKIKNIKENDLSELEKIYVLDNEWQFNFKSYIKKLNIIKEKEIDLSLFEGTKKYFDLTQFEVFGINDINWYLLLDDVFWIIKEIKKIFWEIKKIENVNFNIAKVHTQGLIEKIIPIDIMTLLDYKYIETLWDLKSGYKIMINNLEKLERFFDDFDIDGIKTKFLDFMSTLRKNNINIDRIKTFNQNISYWIDDLEILQRFLEIKLDIKELIEFYEEYPSYFEKKRELEKKSATHLFGNLADRFIDYYSNNRNDLQTIKKLFWWKIQIGDESQNILLEILQNFLITVWVIIINIRDIFQYLPLQKDLFDVIIIDEASQVSIWQAFMLLPLAKKVVVLGDKKQFPNIIAMNSDRSIDDYYFQEILALWKNDLEKSRLEIFRVRNSILDYMQRVCNFEIMLKYHFRWYSDLISYSNKIFYNSNLIVPKIRSKKINDIIKFDFLEAEWVTNMFGETTWLIEVISNTNKKEAEFIFSKLQEFKETTFQWTIGILTPFRDQQKYIQSMIYVSEIKERFEKDCKWIIATFDTCQWQEKDYIFYSMVTNWWWTGKGSWNLNTIFPVKMWDLSDDEVKLKEARLNVGFSRSKEAIHFIVSSPLERIWWAIGDALRHFYAKITNDIEDQVDKNSEREKDLIKWIKSTDFYINHYQDISIIPQFAIGEYLNQINNAKIPHYRVDFLCTIKKWDKHKIFIVEYDWFEYHFDDQNYVNQDNWGNYQVEKDIERQKIIEYYGYQFLRYNKFILGNNPIEKINNHLYDLYNSI